MATPLEGLEDLSSGFGLIFSHPARDAQSTIDYGQVIKRQLRRRTVEVERRILWRRGEAVPRMPDESLAEWADHYRICRLSKLNHSAMYFYVDSWHLGTSKVHSRADGKH